MNKTTTRNIASAVALGTVSALFVSSGLIVNSVLSAGKSSWAWTAALRYLLLLPVLVPILLIRRKFLPLIRTITRIPRIFFWWGSIGFGVFYALLVYAGQFGNAFFVGESTVLFRFLYAVWHRFAIFLFSAFLFVPFPAGIFLFFRCHSPDFYN